MPIGAMPDAQERRTRDGGRMRRTILTGAVGALLTGTYLLVLRRPVMTWGSQPEEADGRLPGDELLEEADGVATRAIDIDAPPEAVWPWLAQMGPAPRGGAYTYDWIENLLGLGMRSADRVLPEFQHPRPSATRSRTGGTACGSSGSSRSTCSRGAPRTATGCGRSCSSRERRRTRLASRNRYRLPTLGARIGMLPMEPASLVMERKMLRGIKERAERLATTTG